MSSTCTLMNWLSTPPLMGLIAPWWPCPPTPIRLLPNSTVAWRSSPSAPTNRALQERQRGADVLIRNLWNDRRSARGLDLLPDCRHEHCLSPFERRRVERGLAPQLPRQVHRLHRDLTLLFPFASSSSRRRARARLSRERTVPIGSSSASATLWYESSSHAKSRSASRSPSGSASMTSATRENSRRASSAAALARASAGPRHAGA